MIAPTTFSFLKTLAKNNHKEWFDKNRKSYEAAKKDVESLADEILKQLGAREPAFKEQKGKNCVFRIFRDVRFAKDKTPYKTHFGIYFSAGGRKSPAAGYYLHIEPGQSFAAGGLWQPEPPVLKSVRQEIDYNLKEFQKILSKSSFKKLFKELEGEQLKTLPQGYTADNPAIEFLKKKSFIVSTKFSDKEVCDKNFPKNLMKVFSEMKPLRDFLNRAFD